jgi:tetratricopeptide (TPR) repeat protein
MTRYAYLAAVLALLLAGCQPPEERAAEYLARARELYAAGDYTKAGVEARNAIQIQPKNADARYLLALVAEQKGEMGQMLSNLAVVIEEDPKNQPAKVKLGTLLVFAQDYNGAGLLADEALALEPNDPAAHVLKARLNLQKQDIPATLASLDKAIELEPGNVDAAALRAGALAIGDPVKAIDDLTASIERVGAKNAEALRQLRVDLLNRIGRNDEVEKELRAMLEEYGGEKYTRNLALLYVSQQRLDDAERVLRDAVTAQPNEVMRKVDLAQFQSKYRRQPEEAEKTLKAFVEQEPDNIQLLVYLGNFYEGTGRDADARATYQNVAGKDPKSPFGIDARNRLAALLLRAGDVPAAQAQLESILEDQPDNVQALLARGEIHHAAGRQAEAIADLRGVLRREPDNATALLILAKAHIATGDQALAEDAYRRLLQSQPANVEALNALAGLLGGSGQLDEATQLLDRALKQDPKNRQALETAVGLALAKDDLKAAEEHARALAALDDPDGVGQRELGRVLEAQNKLGPANEAYKKSLQKKSDSTIALEGVVRTYQVSGKFAEATRYLKAHLEEHPDHVLARVLLGGNLIRAGQFKEAQETLTQAVDQQPKLVRAYMVLAAAYPQDRDQRIEVLKRGLKANPGAGSLAVLLAGEYQAAGNVDEAIKLYEATVQAGGGDNQPQVVNNLAALLLDYRSDEASYRRALDMAQRFANSRSPMFLDTLGWAHYRNKDYDAAIRFLELAVAYGRSQPEARYHLGMAYLAADNKEGARQELEKAVKQAPPAARWAAAAKETLDGLQSGAPAAGAG